MMAEQSHIVALSGGKDSTAMALRLAEVEPQEYSYAITPTGDELPEMFDHWKKLEVLLGQRLTVLTSGYSLSGLIRKKKALPNWRMRFCTPVLKIQPFNAHLMENRPAVSYVGLRADEPADVRRGAVFGNVEGITQRFPLREWGWTINDVWAYLDAQGVTIPARTDCARCFFQTLGEWWWLWKEHLEEYLDAEAEEEETGHTFRSPQRDSWPTSLVDLRREFEKDHIPKGAGQLDLMGGRPNMCRVCSL
jgi:3'-phosphoadenosine 5'-phosphosulfate sulfotransferase (PAPS reductase)/FAD synthetase